MPAAHTAAQLTAFPRRAAGSNAERLAANWLRDEIRSPKRTATLEPFWCRPNWALAHAWHVVLAIAGSLTMVSNALVGGALVLASLLCVLADALTGHSPGRRLTLERASQNVVSTPRTAEPRQSRLIITANYDAGRAGLMNRLRPLAAAARAAGAPGWLGWLVIADVWLILIAVVRHGDGDSASTAVGVLQLIPSVGLVLGLALLLESAIADPGPAAADNAAGVAVAIALTRALDAAPPRRLSVELVLQGAGDRGMIGLRRHLRARRKELDRRHTIVLGIGPVGPGTPAFLTSDGPLIPLRFHRRLRALATQLGAQPRRGRGTSPALPARAAGIPAITLASLDARGLAAHSPAAQDTAENLDPAALDRLLQLALTFVDAIDADLGERKATAPPAPEPAPAQR